MGATLRESLNVLHTWTGLVVGVVLFAICWTAFRLSGKRICIRINSPVDSNSW